MEIQKNKIESVAYKFSAVENGQEVGRAYLYVIQNGLHPEPYGLLEDVFVSELARRGGLGTQLVQMVIDEAKSQGCYKLIGTSREERPHVHAWYKKMGFSEHGKEFRINL